VVKKFAVANMFVFDLKQGDQMQAVALATNDQTNFRRTEVMDRRSGKDQRQVYSLDYFLSGGIERRGTQERRTERREMRRGWVRISKWNSACLQ
jgi:hypothetical protein